MSLKKGTKDVSLLTKIPPKLGTKDITINGIYKASDENLDGYSEVNVKTSGVDINDYWNTVYSKYDYNVNNQIMSLIKKIPVISSPSSVTDMSSLYRDLVNVREIDVTKLNTQNVTDFKNMFSGCRRCEKIIGLSDLDFSKGKNFSYMFYFWKGRTGFTLDLSKVNMNGYNYSSMFRENFVKILYLQGLDFSNCNYCEGMFEGATGLESVIFKKNHNMGKGFLTTVSENYYSYKMSLRSCSRLTHDSLMSYINGLYDIKTAGIKPQQLIIGSTNLAKLTSEEIAIATNKGWNVS